MGACIMIDIPDPGALRITFPRDALENAVSSAWEGLEREWDALGDELLTLLRRRDYGGRKGRRAERRLKAFVKGAWR